MAAVQKSLAGPLQVNFVRKIERRRPVFVINSCTWTPKTAAAGVPHPQGAHIGIFIRQIDQTSLPVRL